MFLCINKKHLLLLSVTVRQLPNTLLGLLLLCMACKTPAVGGTASSQANPVTSNGYQLVWADEFNKDGTPDTTNWRFEKGFVRNNEEQWYQQENATCKNGLLVIEARAVQLPNPNYIAGDANWRKSRREIRYTSASMNTATKKFWQYGRFEMRGKIDVSSGLWPAWWTLGVKGRWPANGEIDIMEYYRGMLLANVACIGSNGKAEWYDRKIPLDSLGGKAWANNFHVWRMDWTEQDISLFVDDVLLNKVPLTSLENKDGSGINPFKQPHYMLLNLALGGDNGGSLAGTTLPNKFEVDYLRVYQKR